MKFGYSSSFWRLMRAGFAPLLRRDANVFNSDLLRVKDFRGFFFPFRIRTAKRLVKIEMFENKIRGY